MLSAFTETEQRREAPPERTLRMLLPSMSEDKDDAARMRALTEDLLRREKSVRLRSIVSDLDHIVHGETDTLVIRPGDWVPSTIFGLAWLVNWTYPMKVTRSGSKSWRCGSRRGSAHRLSPRSICSSHGGRTHFLKPSIILSNA